MWTNKDVEDLMTVLRSIEACLLRAERSREPSPTIVTLTKQARRKRGRPAK